MLPAVAVHSHSAAPTSLLGSAAELTLPSLSAAPRPPSAFPGSHLGQAEGHGTSAPVSSAASPTALLGTSSQSVTSDPGLFMGGQGPQQGTQQQQPPPPPPSAAGSDDGSQSKGWSSLDGIPRPAPTSWHPSPSDGILQSSQAYPPAAAVPQRPGSTGPSASLPLTHLTLGGDFPHHGSMPHLGGAQAQGGAAAAAALAAHQRSQSVPPPQGLAAELAGLTPAQQQLLQQHLLMQQQQQQQAKGGTTSMLFILATRAP